MDEHLKIIGNHPEIRNVRRRIRRVAPTKLHVIIYGERGTEKEPVAREIHRKSLREQNIFMMLDCQHLLDDEPGAEELLQNTFNKTWKGTLFIENIELMPFVQQEQLYRLLSITGRVYSTSPAHKPQGVRIISATTDAAFKEHDRFHRDLALLILQYEIAIVPVRDRKSDIPLLFDYYYSLAAEKRGYKEKPAVPEELFQSMLTYEWKGNIAEMRNVIDSMLEMSPEHELSPEAFPFVIPKNPMAFLDKLVYHTALSRVDEYLIRRALERSGWNQTRAARILNMTEGNIRLKIKKYGIKKEN